MSTVVRCPRCQTPLLTSLKPGPADVRASFLMSSAMIGNGLFALNVCRAPNGECPICGTIAGRFGCAPPETPSPIRCGVSLDEPSLTLLAQHAARSSLREMTINRNGKKSGRYYLAHSALRNLVFNDRPSLFGRTSGAVALADPGSSGRMLGLLCDIVARGTGDKIPPPEPTAEAYAIEGGTCVVVEMPRPQVQAEAFLVGVVTDVDLRTQPDKPIDGVVLYFTLELTAPAGDVQRTVLGEWKHYKRKNYGVGPIPTVAEFVECLDRVWSSRIWRPEQAH